MTIDDDLLLEAVRTLNEANETAHARNVRVELGEIADDGGYFDVRVVAADLAELKSLGRLEHAPAIEWNDSEPAETGIAYVLPS